MRVRTCLASFVADCCAHDVPRRTAEQVLAATPSICVGEASSEALREDYARSRWTGYALPSGVIPSRSFFCFFWGGIVLILEALRR